MKKMKTVALFLVLSLAMSLACLAAGNGTVTVDDVSGKNGETVEIKVEMASNPGIIALCMSIDYDEEILTLVDVVDGKLFKGAASTFSKSVNNVPYTMIWEDALALENHTETGTLIVLKFRIADTAGVGKTSVKINISQPSTFDIDLNEVAFKVKYGSVTVKGDSVTVKEKTTTAVQKITSAAERFPEIVSGITENSTISKRSQTSSDSTAKPTDVVAGKLPTLKPCDHNDTQWQTVIVPNCFSGGKNKLVCLDCWLTLRVEKVNSPGHKMGDWNQTGSEEAGIRTEERVCAECGFREIQKLASNNSVVETQTDISNVVIPTIVEQTEEETFSVVREDTESTAETQIQKNNDNNTEPKRYTTIIVISVLLCLVVAIPLSVHKIRQGR